MAWHKQARKRLRYNNLSDHVLCVFEVHVVLLYTSSNAW